MEEPKRFWQGDTVTWTKSLSDYPSTDGWTLTYYFSQLNDSQTVVAVGEPDGSYTITLTPAQSAAFAAETYQWQAKVTKGADVHTVGTYFIDVQQSLESPAETRTNAQVILEAIEAMMQGKATRDQAKVTVGGQSLDRYSWNDLVSMHQHFKSLVKREQVAASGQRGGIPSSDTVWYF